MYESSEEEKPKEKRGRGRPPGSKSNRKYKRIIEESESDMSFDPENAEESKNQNNDDDREWDNACYVCMETENMIERGELLLCEGCVHVGHVMCAGLTKVPNGDWHCEDCQVKMMHMR